MKGMSKLLKFSSSKFDVAEKIHGCKHIKQKPSSNLCVSSGEFRKSFITVQNLSTFSHIVEVERVSRSIVKLYLREGKDWAFYKTWNKKSDPGNAEAKKFEYEHVELQLSSLSAEEDLKVVGFRTLFSTVHHCLAYLIPARNYIAAHSFLTGCLDVMLGWCQLDHGSLIFHPPLPPFLVPSPNPSYHQ